MSGADGPLAGRLAVWRERERWAALLRFAAFVLPLAAALPLASRFLGPVGRGRLALAWVAAAAVLAVLGYRARRRRVGEREVAAHLDRVWPELEDSAGLLAVPRDRLSPLPAMQRRRIEKRLAAQPAAAGLPWRPLREALRGLLLSALCTAALAVGGRLTEPADRGTARPGAEVAAGAPNLGAPGLSGLVLTVTPPAYTGLAPWSVSELGVEAPEGSRLEWRIETSGTADRVWLTLDESRELPAAAIGSGSFTAELRLAASHVVALHLAAGDARFSTPLARIAAVRDRAPALEIEEPEAGLELAPDALRRIPLRVRGRDDYGMADAEIVATLATGAGESVRFRERRLTFDRADGPATERLYRAVLDPAALGLEAGSELYLFVEGGDRRVPEPNRTRSASRVIRISGGEGASVGLGAGLPILRLPEYFRSQRQIILDTEKLLADRDGLTAAEVARRSQALGFDQRSLRMRYGGLLGEEFESGSPVGDESEEREMELGDSGRAGASIAELLEELPAGVAHQHDAAEINTFFDDRVKAQMRASLAEMWGAEGELRRSAPETALPYEYRALALLKRAQEAVRVYVQKVGFEAPPLQPQERRLTGELDEVRAGRRAVRSAAALPLPEVRDAIRSLRTPPGGAGLDRRALAVARERLVARAVETARPEDLAALEILGRWLDGGGAGAPSEADAATVERALWGLLPAPGSAPGREAGADDELGLAYRRRLEGTR